MSELIIICIMFRNIYGTFINIFYFVHPLLSMLSGLAHSLLPHDYSLSLDNRWQQQEPLLQEEKNVR